MASKNHVHKYHYIPIGRKPNQTFVYACALPDCTHHIPAHQQKLVIGKKSICWECEKQMIMSKDIFRRKTRKPRCWECRGVSNPVVKTETAKPEEKEILTDAIDMLLRMRLGE